MPFAKRGDVVHSEATSGFNNQKKSLLINGLAALGDSLRPLQTPHNKALFLQGFFVSAFWWCRKSVEIHTFGLETT